MDSFSFSFRCYNVRASDGTWALVVFGSFSRKLVDVVPPIFLERLPFEEGLSLLVEYPLSFNQ